MADPRFFNNAGPFSLRQLADIAGAQIGGAGTPDLTFGDVATLDGAGPGDISHFHNALYLEAFTQSHAGACTVHADFVDRAPKGMALLVSRDPYGAYARIAQAFYPTQQAPSQIHPAAHVDASATLGPGTSVASGAVIEAGAEIGAGCTIGANSSIGPGVVLGDGSHVGPNVTIQCAIIGKGCIFHPGARIGQDGFGFAPGGPPDGHIKVVQLGRVMIGDGVEVGANSTIDRGTLEDTVIGPGTKIDNLVQIAHGVTVGAGCFMAAQVGISGSTIIGNFVMMGGQAATAGHLSIGDGARVGGKAGIMRDVAPGEEVVGSPALPKREFFRQVAALARLTKPKTNKKKREPSS